MNKKSDSTSTNNPTPPINIKTLEEAIEILNKPKMSDDEINSMIATLADLRGAETIISEFMPKDMVVIGTGDMSSKKLFPDLKIHD